MDCVLLFLPVFRLKTLIIKSRATDFFNYLYTKYERKFLILFYAVRCLFAKKMLNFNNDKKLS